VNTVTILRVPSSRMTTNTSWLSNVYCACWSDCTSCWLALPVTVGGPKRLHITGATHGLQPQTHTPARLKHVTQPRITYTIRKDAPFFPRSMASLTQCRRTCVISRLHQPYRLSPRCWKRITTPHCVLGLPALSFNSWRLNMGPISCPETSVGITTTCCVIAPKSAVL